MARAKDLPCAQCGKMTWSGSTSLPPGQATCRECRRSRPGYRDHAKRTSVTRWNCQGCGKQCERPPTKGQRPKWCSEQCRYLATYEAKRTECRLCGGWIKGRGDVHAACERAESKRRRARARLVKASEGRPANPRWAFVVGTCRYCGEPFTRRGAASAYCSSRCRRRDRPSGSFISKSGRLAIYERDGWICQLCLEPVDPSLHYLDDWAASLDHIEPQAWALIPDHSPSNLRLAHRWCNSVRGDLSHYSDSDLRPQSAA